jgi:hypothetical protein
MMSCIDLNWDFSQFDRDNMNRYMAAAKVENATTVDHLGPRSHRLRD